MKLHHYISYVFHPILVPIVSSLLYFIIIPTHVPKEFSYKILGLIFIVTYIIPILLLYFLKKVRLIESYQLPTIEERKFPILFFILLTFLIGNLLLRTETVNLLAYSFYGCSLAMGIVYLLFLGNIKTSLHSIGIAGLLGFVGVISYEYKLNLLVLIISLFLLFGIVATSRLKLEAHKISEIYIGFIIGVFTQALSYLYFSI
jgi:membrane-associated phospholipid phosphatase